MERRLGIMKSVEPILENEEKKEKNVDDKKSKN